MEMSELLDKPMIKSAKSVDRQVIVEFTQDKSINFEDCWLRDNCRCNSCYRADTFQRAIHILEVPDTKVLELVYEDTTLLVTWDDGHESHYDAAFLSNFDYVTWSECNRLKPILWSGTEVAAKVKKIHINEFLNSAEGEKVVFQSLLDYGIALIEGVDPSLEATEKICEALGGVQHTLFGGMWKLTTNAEHADTAYSTLRLATHTDSTYFTESTGLQIFHCTEHANGSGGETVLADGFYGASRLKEEHLEDFHFLTRFEVEAEFIEERHHHKHSAPVIKVNEKTGDFKQIRYNVYDRSAMAFQSGEECRRYYRALRYLARYYENSRNQWQFKLEPGLVLAIDNFRVLHGRTQFTGKRVLYGSYVARSDWLDRARTLKLIQ